MITDLPCFPEPGRSWPKFSITVVRNMHLEGKVRSTGHFDYHAASAYDALRIWMQCNHATYSRPPGGILFIAIHPTNALKDADAVRNLLAGLSPTDS